MPLLGDEEFLARLQKNNWVRWRYKLELGEVLSVYVQDPRTVGSGSFQARLTRTVALPSQDYC